MPDAATLLLLVYSAGVIVGVIAIDDTFPTRIGLAVLWPLGPLAFLVVVAILLLAMPIALPRAAAALAALIAAGWMFYRMVS